MEEAGRGRKFQLRNKLLYTICFVHEEPFSVPGDWGVVALLSAATSVSCSLLKQCVHKNFSKRFPRQISEKSKEKEKDKNLAMHG
jgi:hypothetical protein